MNWLLLVSVSSCSPSSSNRRTLQCHNCLCCRGDLSAGDPEQALDNYLAEEGGESEEAASASDSESSVVEYETPNSPKLIV